MHPSPSRPFFIFFYGSRLLACTVLNVSLFSTVPTAEANYVLHLEPCERDQVLVESGCIALLIVAVV